MGCLAWIIRALTKAEFLGHQIPVQEFEFETTEIPDNRLQYVLNNMGLATYAKLGGTPAACPCSFTNRTRISCRSWQCLCRRK